MKAELIDQMGTDLTVCNSARVSFDKTSEWETIKTINLRESDWMNQAVYNETQQLSEKDQKLISYLGKHEHFTPFTHVMITMRETVPIFVARQRFKHVVGFTYNEISRRYVDDAPEFYYPDVWRKAAENKKQGSSDEEVTHLLAMDASGFRPVITHAYEDFLVKAHELYNFMLSAGVAPEQARMVLPQSMYTSYYVTGSLSAWARAYKLRSDEHAQKEIQDLASMWHDIIGNIEELKYSWKALTSE